MANKYKHFWRTNQNKSQTKHRKKFMSSKKNNNWAIPADFSPLRYEVIETSHFPTKNPKINPFFVKSLLESNCKRFRQSAIRENFILKPETQLKKNSFQKPRQQYPPIQRSKRKSVTSLPPFMSEPYLSTRSKTSMHLKMFKVSSSLRRPETYFRHTQGHQRTSALTGSINIFQGTTITVYEV